MRKTLTYGVIVIGVTVTALAGLYIYAANTFTFDLSSEGATAAHNEARESFLSELPETACLRAEDIIPLARERGWDARPEPAFDWCVRPANIAKWLRVTVDPPLPFSTDDENAQIFAFDAQGCAVDWAYASGPGTTCPD